MQSRVIILTFLPVLSRLFFIPEQPFGPYPAIFLFLSPFFYIPATQLPSKTCKEHVSPKPSMDLYCQVNFATEQNSSSLFQLHWFYTHWCRKVMWLTCSDVTFISLLPVALFGHWGTFYVPFPSLLTLDVLFIPECCLFSVIAQQLNNERKIASLFQVIFQPH